MPIQGARELREGSFLIIAADEKREKSGCSIDRMFGTLKSLERELSVQILDSTGSSSAMTETCARSRAASSARQRIPTRRFST